MRRFTRLTNGFSKKFENHAHMVAIYAVWYNGIRIHKTLRVTPAMAAELTDRLWSLGGACRDDGRGPAGQEAWPSPENRRRNFKLRHYLFSPGLDGWRGLRLCAGCVAPSHPRCCHAAFATSPSVAEHPPDVRWHAGSSGGDAVRRCR